MSDIVNRLRELADAVTRGRDAVASEFTMSVPSRPERDADLVLSAAADEIERLRATLERQQLSYEREREIDQDEIERLIALRRDDARVLERMRAMIAEAEVLAEYGRDDGLRDWVDAGAWLSPGDRIVVQGLPPQVTNEQGHVLTTAALWKMYVEDHETPDEPRADHDAAMADAARFRWLDEAALTVDMVSDGDNQTLIDIVADNRPLTIRGADLRDAVDKAMKRHNAGMTC